MFNLLICEDNSSDLAYVVMEDLDGDRSRIVDWDLSEDEIERLTEAFSVAEGLPDDVGAEPVSGATFEEMVDQPTQDQSRCDWVRGGMTVRSAFRHSRVIK